MKEIKVKLTFTEPILGSSSGNPDLHKDFIASKAPDAKSREEEIEAIGAEEVEKKEMTVFPRLPDGTPFIWDYQIRGFFKHACGVLKIVGGNKSAAIKAHKKYIDTMVFIKERRVPFNYDGEISSFQRPLRGQTAQGERIALANSEMINAGATIEFTIQLLKEDLEDAVLEWLDYGKFNGIGQFRNGSFGRFNFEII